MKYINAILFFLICHASPSSFANKPNQTTTSPSKHNQPLSTNIPPIKLGNKAKEMDLGTCEYLDYYIYYCKPFSCALKMPVPGSYKLSFNVHGPRAGGTCNINYKFDISTNQGENIPFKISCNLTKDAVESFRYQWKYYSNGYVDVFTRRSEDPLLKKQCKASIEM